jgi:hypothetical protein
MNFEQADLFADAPPIEKLRHMFDASRTMQSPNRLKRQKCRDYYDGPEQLNSEVRRVLGDRRQPAIYSNRIRPMIEGVLGTLAANKVDPRCSPRNPNQEDENASDIATKTLRFIVESGNFQETILDCAENFLIEGTEAAIVEADGETIPITQIRYEEFFSDPYSRRNDFKDATYMGIAQWKDEALIRATWPDRADQYAGAFDGGAFGAGGAIDATWQDRPQTFTSWVDTKRRRMMVIEMYFNEGGEWWRIVYCALGLLEYSKSPYKNVKTGETRNPIEAESCYVDRENQRYGRVDDAIPIQDEVNSRRGRLLHLANSRQIQERELGASMVDADTARKEAARADGVIPVGWQLVPTSDMARGQEILLAESKGEIERMGPTPAVLGQREGGSGRSGRASQILQQAGMTEIARPLARHAAFQERCYKAAWLNAQQFWTAEMFIRVTDETRAPEFLKINEPIMGIVQQPVVGPDGQPQIDPTTGQPETQQIPGVVGTKNRIAEMDMDIIVSSAPDTATLQQEVFADLKELVTGGMDPFSPEFELIVEMSPMADKMRVLEVIKAKREEREQAQGQQMQEQQKIAEVASQAQLDEMAGKIAKLESESQKNKADTELIEAQTDKTKAETLRLMAEPYKHKIKAEPWGVDTGTPNDDTVLEYPPTG